MVLPFKDDFGFRASAGAPACVLTMHETFGQIITFFLETMHNAHLHMAPNTLGATRDETCDNHPEKMRV